MSNYTMEDITADDAAVIVSSSKSVTAVGIPTADTLSDNSLGVHLIGATAISDMSKWVRADCTLAILRRHGTDALRNVSDVSGIPMGTLQNAATTAHSWPHDMRQSSRWQTYSHHQALNALNNAEKLRLIHLCAEQEISVGRIRGMVKGRVDADTVNDIETRWETTQRTLDHWTREAGIQIERTGKSVTLNHEGQSITFKAVVLPSGQPAIELGE